MRNDSMVRYIPMRHGVNTATNLLWWMFTELPVSLALMEVPTLCRKV